MRCETLSFLFLLGLVLPAVQVAQASVPQMPPGLVLVAKINGDANMSVNGVTTALKVDEMVPEAATIITSPSASVVLVFSSGTTVILGEETELVVERFLQEPFGMTIKVSEMQEEPSPSNTRLRLNKGELMADVKRLHLHRGSSFSVSTPAGDVGVRGTKFRILLRPNAQYKTFFAVSVATGAVLLRPPVGPPATSAVGELMVATGQEVILILPLSGGPLPPLPTATVPMSVTGLKAITAGLAEMGTAVQSAAFKTQP